MIVIILIIEIIAIIIRHEKWAIFKINIKSKWMKRAEMENN
jgi:hypothetical protein